MNAGAAGVLEAGLLEVRGLSIEFPARDGGWTPIVEDVGLSVARGETVGLVGESGSGKTLTSLALPGLLPFRGGRVSRGSIRFEGTEIVGASEKSLRKIRGERIGMIFQQPLLSLNPAYSVGDQIAETVRRHRGTSTKEAWRLAVAMLERVGISDAASRAHDYPHRFSGGMCQRVMIAQALVCEPSLLIADEPTTALDVTIQARVLQLMRALQADMGLAVLLITHDLGVIAEMCDRVMVMYAGQIVESGPVAAILGAPRHPYTEALIGAVPTAKTRRLVSVRGNVPSPGAMPAGCRFAPRCPTARAGTCDSAAVPLREIGAGHHTRCARFDDLYAKGGAAKASPAGAALAPAS